VYQKEVASIVIEKQPSHTRDPAASNPCGARAQH